jgi:hypothetical protein
MFNNDGLETVRIIPPVPTPVVAEAAVVVVVIIVSVACGCADECAEHEHCCQYKAGQLFHLVFPQVIGKPSFLINGRRQKFPTTVCNRSSNERLMQDSYQGLCKTAGKRKTLEYFRVFDVANRKD